MMRAMYGEDSVIAKTLWHTVVSLRLAWQLSDYWPICNWCSSTRTYRAQFLFHATTRRATFGRTIISSLYVRFPAGNYGLRQFYAYTV